MFEDKKEGTTQLIHNITITTHNITTIYYIINE